MAALRSESETVDPQGESPRTIHFDPETPPNQEREATCSQWRERTIKHVGKPAAKRPGSFQRSGWSWRRPQLRFSRTSEFIRHRRSESSQDLYKEVLLR